MRFKSFLFTLVFLLFPTLSLSQTGILQGKEGVYAIFEDFRGERLEGYLRSYPEELTVSTKDNQEKTVPLKYIESIKLEKVYGSLPGTEQMGGEAYYSVRLQNSQEIFTLRHKYTFSLATGIGLVTRTIDPDRVQSFSRQDSFPATQSQSDQPFIRDKSVVFSLEFKF
jgi:hypothetical protein